MRTRVAERLCRAFARGASGEDLAHRYRVDESEVWAVIRAHYGRVRDEMIRREWRRRR